MKRSCHNYRRTLELQQTSSFVEIKPMIVNYCDYQARLGQGLTRDEVIELDVEPIH
jgi:hypothetical protein